VNLLIWAVDVAGALPFEFERKLPALVELARNAGAPKSEEGAAHLHIRTVAGNVLRDDVSRCLLLLSEGNELVAELD
jgi:hypothetical protein